MLQIGSFFVVFNDFVCFELTLLKLIIIVRHLRHPVLCVIQSDPIINQYFIKPKATLTPQLHTLMLLCVASIFIKNMSVCIFDLAIRLMQGILFRFFFYFSEIIILE